MAKIILGEESQTIKDLETAIGYLKTAQCNQVAQYQLAKLFLMGKVVPRDKNTAIKWFILSAEQGNECSSGENTLSVVKSHIKVSVLSDLS